MQYKYLKSIQEEDIRLFHQELNVLKNLIIIYFEHVKKNKEINIEKEETALKRRQREKEGYFYIYKKFNNIGISITLKYTFDCSDEKIYKPENKIVINGEKKDLTELSSLWSEVIEFEKNIIQERI